MDNLYKKVRYIFTKKYQYDVARQTYLEEEAKKPDSKLRLKDRGPGLRHIIEYSKDNVIPTFRIPVFKSDYKTEINKGQEPGK